MSLSLNWCSYEAAKFAVERWHYLRKMPQSRIAKIGVWESGRFVGAVTFSRGANCNITKMFGLGVTQICELTRVALGMHESPTSRIVAIATRMLKRAMPGLRLIVSYADTEQGHVGTLYQACGWIYVGLSKGQSSYIVRGRRLHRRTLTSAIHAVCANSLPKAAAINLIDPGWQVYRTSDKHCYVYPLDDDMRKRVEPMRKPYPKRDARVRSAESGTPDNQPEGALQCDPDA